MKLLSKYYRVNITATIIVVLVSSVFYYLLIHQVLLEQLDNALKVEEQEVTDHAKQNNSLPKPSYYHDQQVIFFELTGPVERKFSTVKIYSKEEKEYITARQLIFSIKVAGKMYKVNILKSQEETENLVKLILMITLIIVLLLLIILFLVNRFLLSRLWKPFNSTIDELKKFNLSGKEKIQLKGSSINEFTELNEAVTIMAGHVSREYNTLKVFTENASHEMQTPLAVINSKLDVLVQDESINEQQMNQLQGIYQALDRLSKLNYSLLLLTRIGNNQFTQTESIPLDKIVKEKLIQFEELTESRQLKITTNIMPAIVRCNKQLLDILLSNLLNNAIRYNLENGGISIIVSKNKLVISNNSALPPLDEKQVFQRFYRHNDTQQEGNGLGLSIVKQICNDAGFSIEYFYRNNQHQFQIYF
jgi:signal transduction histidine kinase